MRFRYLVVLGLLLTPLLGCAAGRSVTVKTVDVPNRVSWVGHTVTQLLAVWGKPDQTQSDGIGGSILTYTRLREISGRNPTGPSPRVGSDGRPLEGPSLVLGEFTGAASDAKEQAEFRVDVNGKIYRYHVASRFQNVRKLTPPAAGDK